MRRARIGNLAIPNKARKLFRSPKMGPSIRGPFRDEVTRVVPTGSHLPRSTGCRRGPTYDKEWRPPHVLPIL
ncbi:hypothetical protein HPP92_013726 [Vanilla planifolia]|uniref:Uncharacterized protein n=1 Tax=Vanilla planifolia TaxID=51239 RepID=A0A835R426_VANPL|nr:hypothetical protein HPP92_013726 [Vanilla planifolia]